MNRHRIPKRVQDLARFKQQEDEKEQKEKFITWSHRFHQAYEYLPCLIREAEIDVTPVLVLPHLISRKESTICKDQKERTLLQQRDIYLQDTRRVLEFVQLIISCVLHALKRVEILTLDLHLYELLGSSFEQWHRQLIQSTRDDHHMENRHVQDVFAAAGASVTVAQNQFLFFFESLRPIELRWISAQPQRFLKLIDHATLSVQMINHHLCFIRKLTDRELAFLMTLTDASWNNFVQCLDSPIYESLLSRYNIFGLCTLAFVLHGSTQPCDAWACLLQTLGPFLSEPEWNRLKTLMAQFPSLPQEVAQLAEQGKLTGYVHLQLLEPEESFLLTLLKSFRTSSSSAVTIPHFSEELAYSVWRDVSGHALFLRPWNELSLDLKAEMHCAHLHPYWQEMWKWTSSKLHARGFSFVKEAQRYQEAIAAKDYYPVYYQYWSYFLVAWLVAFLLVALLVVAIAAYGTQRTHATRLYLAERRNK